MTHHVDVVRGQLTDEVATDVLAFWSAHGAIADEGVARDRLTEIVCVLRDDDGAIAGVNSVTAAPVPLIADSPFWIYRRFLAPDVPADADERMAVAAFDALEAAHGPDDAPRGICLLARPGDRMRQRPEAVWPGTALLYAGYGRGEAQVRIRYFEHDRGRVEPLRLYDVAEAGYRIERFDGRGPVTADEVLALWKGPAGLADEEARRRLPEVILVATDDDGRLAGITSAYLKRNDRLGLDLWHVRTYVAFEHRKAHLATQMMRAAVQLLDQRFDEGADAIGAGVIVEIENEGLKQRPTRGRFRSTDLNFIGLNERGDHVRVHYFPGVHAPPPWT